MVYKGFDCPYVLNMMEGDQQADFPLVQGQVMENPCVGTLSSEF